MSAPARIGPYVLLGELGRGGMGAVYEVEDPRLGRRLALKLNLSNEASSEARFLREAELLARVQHPNVVAIHAQGRVAQGPYLVTDLVDGRDLDVAFGGRPARPDEAIRIVRDLADAVEAVHQAGILHRDLKPANVILRADGSPVLLDFGIARDLTGEALTQTGTTVGTAAYMSPEQANGISPRHLNARTDVYGLGAILLFLLSGHAPFTKTGLMALLKAVMLDEPEWPSDLPAALDGILRKALAKERLDRYVSAAALRDDLDRCARGEPTVAPTHRPRSRRAAVGAGLGLGLLGLLGVWATFDAEPGPEPPSTLEPAPAPVRVPPGRPRPGQVASKRFRLLHAIGRPTSHLTAFTAGGQLVTVGQTRHLGAPMTLAVWSPRTWETQSQTPVTGSVAALACEGTSVLVLVHGPTPHRGRLLRWEVDGGGIHGQPTATVKLPGWPRAMAIAPTNGDRVAVALTTPRGRHEVHIVELRSEESRLLGKHELQIHALAWGGIGLVSVSGRSGKNLPGEGAIKIWRPESDEPELLRLRTPNDQVQGVAIVGEREYFVGTTGWRIHRLPRSVRKLAAGRQLVGTRTRSRFGTGGKPGAHNGSVRALAWSRGRLYSISGEQPNDPGTNEVRAWDVGPRPERNLGAVTSLPLHGHHVSASPDGAWLAISYRGLSSAADRYVELLSTSLLSGEEVLEYAQLPAAVKRDARER